MGGNWVWDMEAQAEAWVPVGSENGRERGRNRWEEVRPVVGSIGNLEKKWWRIFFFFEVE